MKTLLVIDMQKGFIKGDNYNSLIDKINNLVATGEYDFVLFTQFKNEIGKNSLYIDRIGWNGLKTKEEQEFVVEVPGNAKIFEKSGYGLEPKDLDYIRSLNINEIDICGCKTEACVYEISLQLWDMGIYPNILINYVEGDISKNTMKKIYTKQFGDVDERK